MSLLKIRMINGCRSIQKYKGKMGVFENFDGDYCSRGWYEWKKKTIYIVKQKNKMRQTITLVHEFCHFTIDILCFNNQGLHELLDMFHQKFYTLVYL